MLTNARPNETDAVTSTMVSITCTATNASRTGREPRVWLELRVPNAWMRPAYSDGNTPKSKLLATHANTVKPSTRPSRIE